MWVCPTVLYYPPPLPRFVSPPLPETGQLLHFFLFSPHNPHSSIFYSGAHIPSQIAGLLDAKSFRTVASPCLGVKTRSGLDVDLVL
ncbi:hypothetical protein CHARACLAT_008812 [Characodon lateralis]|uniref:Uncharacterized protein n=1 Tax=Characodon lateralis TaxID=208331 RepID=A0ABU7F3P4_9TELE|nr:hypothetical protein [Characodon lateralis]